LPRDLRTVVDAWTARKLRRNTVNQRLQLVKYALSWGAEQELIPEATAALLSRVRPLRANRTQATEGDQVTSAPLRSIVAVLRELRRQRFTRVSVALILAQYYCGCRPSEACRLSLAELHRGGTVQIGRRVHRVPAGVWIFRPTQHKNKHRGKVVVYAIGPRLQRILAPYVAAAEARGDKPGYLFTTSRRPGRSITRRRYAEHIDHCDGGGPCPRPDGRGVLTGTAPAQLPHPCGCQARYRRGVARRLARDH
jgi:integrase